MSAGDVLRVVETSTGRWGVDVYRDGEWCPVVHDPIRGPRTWATHSAALRWAARRGAVPRLLCATCGKDVSVGVDGRLMRHRTDGGKLCKGRRA